MSIRISSICSGPVSAVDIDYPTEKERADIWMEIAREHPSVRGVDRDQLVRFSQGMPRFDMHMAAREAIEEAYKDSLTKRRYIPVTTDNLFDKLAAYQPLDSPEYKALEQAVVDDFQEGARPFGRPVEGGRAVMDITRRCDYALRILEAAYESGDSYVSVADISEQEDIPYAFARSIQHDLVKGGLIKTVRGARGGLALDCDPAQITLLEVLEAVQGPVSVSLCAVDAEYCKRRGGCSYNKLWMGADSLLNSYFDSITLKELMEQGGRHPVIRKAIDSAPPYGAHVLPGGRVRRLRRATRYRGSAVVGVARKSIADLAASAVWPAGAAMSQDEFCRYVLSEGQRLYRDLPWRGIDDAYGVLVSEVMLQQTQVKRVLGRWERWMGMFPSPDALAAAAPADVLGRMAGARL